MTKNVRKVIDAAIATGTEPALTIAARYLDMEARKTGKPADIAAARAMWERIAKM